jgi:hypothetical protein
VTARLELYWIPLGAGGGTGARVVRTSGRTYERLVALLQRRAPQRLFHAALVADTAGGRVVVEMTPVPRVGRPEERGVVSGGPVGSRLLGRARVFRYEVRRWSGGVIPDIGYAIGGPVVISTEPDEVRCVLDLLAEVPAAVWGRDEAGVGDMWNSNSVVSWTLDRAGIVDRAGLPPHHGRAPGWAAGIAVARRASGAGTPIGADLLRADRTAQPSAPSVARRRAVRGQDRGDDP